MGISEMDGRAVLRARFAAAGYRIAEDVALTEGELAVTLDGWDGARRVGYELITTEAGDRLEFSTAATDAIEARMRRGELYVLLVDADDVESGELLAFAADQFLARVATLLLDERATPPDRAP